MSDPITGTRGERLSAAQHAVLRLLARHNDDAPLSSPEISRSLRRRYDDWSYGKLRSLERRGFVERLGTTFSGGQCWHITTAGRAALAQSSPDGETETCT